MNNFRHLCICCHLGAWGGPCPETCDQCQSLATTGAGNFSVIFLVGIDPGSQTRLSEFVGTVAHDTFDFGMSFQANSAHVLQRLIQQLFFDDRTFGFRQTESGLFSGPFQSSFSGHGLFSGSLSGHGLFSCLFCDSVSSLCLVLKLLPGLFTSPHTIRLILWFVDG